MLNASRAVGALISLVLLAGCAAPAQRFSVPDQPVKREGYSVLPPIGTEWFYTERQQFRDYDLVFWQPRRTATYTKIAVVSESFQPGSFATPQDFLQLVERTKHTESDPERFRIVEQRVAMDPRFGAYSVAVYSVREDHAPAVDVSVDHLVLRTYEYRFAHPKARDTIVTVKYSERGLPGELDARLAVEAQAFFAGIVLDASEAPARRMASIDPHRP